MTLRKALEDAQSAISTLPSDIFGMASDDASQWPIRDELLAKIDAALSPADPPSVERDSGSIWNARESLCSIGEWQKEQADILYDEIVRLQKNAATSPAAKVDAGVRDSPVPVSKIMETLKRLRFVTQSGKWAVDDAPQCVAAVEVIIHEALTVPIAKENSPIKTGPAMTDTRRRIVYEKPNGELRFLNGTLQQLWSIRVADADTNGASEGDLYEWRDVMEAALASHPLVSVSVTEIAQVLLDRFIQRGKCRSLNGVGSFRDGTTIASLPPSYKDDFIADAEAVNALFNRKG